MERTRPRVRVLVNLELQIFAREGACVPLNEKRTNLRIFTDTN